MATSVKRIKTEITTSPQLSTTSTTTVGKAAVDIGSVHLFCQPPALPMCDSMDVDSTITTTTTTVSIGSAIKRSNKWTLLAIQDGIARHQGNIDMAYPYSQSPQKFSALSGLGLKREEAAILKIKPFSSTEEGGDNDQIMMECLEPEHLLVVPAYYCTVKNVNARRTVYNHLPDDATECRLCCATISREERPYMPVDISHMPYCESCYKRLGAHSHEFALCGHCAGLRTFSLNDKEMKVFLGACRHSQPLETTRAMDKRDLYRASKKRGRSSTVAATTFLPSGATMMKQTKEDDDDEELSTLHVNKRAKLDSGTATITTDLAPSVPAKGSDHHHSLKKVKEMATCDMAQHIYNEMITANHLRSIYNKYDYYGISMSTAVTQLQPGEIIKTGLLCFLFENLIASSHVTSSDFIRRVQYVPPKFYDDLKRFVDCEPGHNLTPKNAKSLLRSLANPKAEAGGGAGGVTTSWNYNLSHLEILLVPILRYEYPPKGRDSGGNNRYHHEECDEYFSLAVVDFKNRQLSYFNPSIEQEFVGSTNCDLDNEAKATEILGNLQKLLSHIPSRLLLPSSSSTKTTTGASHISWRPYYIPGVAELPQQQSSHVSVKAGGGDGRSNNNNNSNDSALFVYLYARLVAFVDRIDVIANRYHHHLVPPFPDQSIVDHMRVIVACEIATRTILLPNVL